MSSGGGGGGKRGANAELNLVPYIDLLSTLICFLLITAVWEQISALSTNGSNASSSESAPAPIDPNRVDLSVSIFTDHVEAAAGSQKIKVENIDGEPNYSELLRIFDQWKNKWPTRSDVTLNSDSQAPYKYLVRMMDTLVEAHFDDVGVNTQ